MTELIDNYAIMRAQELDDYFEKHKKPMGPFHGLPISLTGNIAMNTLPLNLGYAGWWGRCGEVDAQILRPMYKLGCLYYVRTTQPLTLIAPEVESNLYGRTLNPFDTRLNATGTSGGEGSLMAMGASSVGVAVDLGTGGIGVTAASSGTYGLRPTCGRLPNFMLVSSLRQDGLPVVPGPISTSLEGISLYMKGVMGTEPWTKDHSLSPLPWIESTSPSASLKIGYLVDDGMVTPDSSIVRAVNLMLQELGRIPGVQLVEWKPVAHEEALKLTSRLLAADGAKDRLEAIESSDEPLLESTKLALKDARESHPLDLEGFAALLRERDNYRFRYGRAWRDTCTEKARDSRVTGTIDVLLCPAGSSVGTLKNQPHYAGYNSVWSLLDYPTLTFSVMRADANADTSSGKSADASTNLPIALQLVARRNQDEKVSSLGKDFPPALSTVLAADPLIRLVGRDIEIYTATYLAPLPCRYHTYR